MKFFEPGDILLSDFDGVYLDSQNRFKKVMNNNSTLQEWMEYLNSIKWYEFLRECEELPYATETFLELQKLGILRGFITRIHSFEEGQEKCSFIREKGLIVPMYYVMPEQPKSEVYLPNKKVILLEDKYENAEDWENKGGKSIVIDPNAEIESNKKIKTLRKLLTK